MAGVKSFLIALVGVERLVPSDRGLRLVAGRRRGADLGRQNLAVAGEALRIGGAVDLRLEVDRMPLAAW